MSSSDLLDLEQTAKEIWIRNCLSVLAIALSLYDYSITSGREIAYIWRRPKTANAYWFFLNRYTGILLKVLALGLMNMNISPDRCKILNILYPILGSLVHLTICSILSMQVIALHGGSRSVGIFLACSRLVMTVIVIWAFSSKRDKQDTIYPMISQYGCLPGVSGEKARELAVSWIVLLVYNSMMFGYIVAQTWKTRRTTPAKIPLMEVVFRDGVTYYVVTSLSLLANIVTFYLCGPFLRGSLTPLTTSIASTMMARLMLNLLEVKTYTANIHTEDYEDVSHVELDTVWTTDLDGHRHTTISITSSTR